MNILVHNVFRRQQKALKSLNVHQKIGEKLYEQMRQKQDYWV